MINTFLGFDPTMRLINSVDAVLPQNWFVKIYKVWLLLNMDIVLVVLVFYFTVTLCQISYSGTSEYQEKCFGLGLNISNDLEEQLEFFDEGKHLLHFEKPESQFLISIETQHGSQITKRQNQNEKVQINFLR